MRIGFYLKWDKGSLSSPKGNVLGDELLGESFCRVLKTFDGVEEAEVYAPNNTVREPVDVMIYMNDTQPCREWGKKQVLYLQNSYRFSDVDTFLRGFYVHNYDGYMFFSNVLLDAHKKTGRDGIYLPFGVDTALFSPREKSARYTCDVSYVGNDIKGAERTTRYLYPATEFDFALYGNWVIVPPPRHRFRFWMNWSVQELPHYKRVFQERSRGKIPQEDVPVLYSSSKINLNCTYEECVSWDVITLRTFEVLACKGFLITDKVPSAESTLRDKVVFTDGNADLTEKIKYYLNHEEERLAIAEKGYEHVVKYGTITSRAHTLLEYVKSVAL